MGKPLMDDPTERVGEVVDLFAKGGDGKSNGVHRVMAMLSRNDKGAPHSTMANMLVILAHDPPFATMFGFDEFTSQHLLLRSPPLMEDGEMPLPGPYPRPWGSEDVSLVQAYIQRVWKMKAPRLDVESGMIAAAARNRFHPVRDYLAALKWDSKSRIDHWLFHAFGCTDDDYHSAIGAKFLIAAVRRIRQPGCKFDHMPVLEGPQGIGKSTVCRELFGTAWFSDAIPDQLASRDAAMALLGIWVLEFAEIQQLIRSEVEVIKAFLSRSTDRYRPPYGKAYVERPRQGVLIGTTNDTDYLRDSSGNRRIWPVACKFADHEWVRANRDQLWAEAAAREASGEAIWLHEDDVRERASRVQEERMLEDAWTDAIASYLTGRLECTVPAILGDCLQIPRERHDRRTQMRVADILKNEGWKRRVTRDLAGKQYRCWVKRAE
jgi:putative DNA primase/helicase